MKRMELTILIEKGLDGYYVGQIQEYPAAISQGKTIDELKTNLKDALTLLLQVQNDELKKQNADKKIIKRKLVINL